MEDFTQETQFPACYRNTESSYAAGSTFLLDKNLVTGLKAASAHNLVATPSHCTGVQL